MEEKLKMHQKKFDKATIQVYPCERADAPVIWCIMYIDSGKEIIEEAKKRGLWDFHLVTTAGIQWDQDLSPWPHAWIIEPNDDFTGGANDFLAFLLNDVKPWVEEVLPDAGEKIINGYSMGGLFSLYSLYNTDYFTKVICVSGSVWYPGFVEYAKSHPLKADVKSIFMSMGKLEIKVKNPVLRTTQDHFEELEAYYRSLGIEDTFVLNPGNHYQHAVERTVNGIEWSMNHPEVNGAKES